MPRACLLLLTIVIAAGCGGGSSAHDSYAAKADAICGKYKRQTDALGSPSDLGSFVRVAGRTLSILHNARDELRTLKPPADEQKTATAWLDQFDVLIRDIEKIRQKAKEGDLNTVQQLAQESLKHNERANQLGRELGMKVCSKD